MSDIVVDSSVLIAVAKGERYEESVVAIIQGAVMSAVNLTEVLAKLEELKIPLSSTPVRTAFALLARIEPFTERHALLTADLRPVTRPQGLSLGDRACLALGITLDADIFTADQSWSQLSIGARIHLIR